MPKSGLVHTAGVTTGKVHDAKVMDNLIREDDRAVYGDKGYASDVKKRAAEEAGVLWAVKEKAKPGPRPHQTAARAQPPLWQSSRQSRACIPRAEMPVRLSQGALSRHRQERCAGVRVARARQYFLGSQASHRRNRAELSECPTPRDNAGAALVASPFPASGRFPGRASGRRKSSWAETEIPAREPGSFPFSRAGCGEINCRRVKIPALGRARRALGRDGEGAEARDSALDCAGVRLSSRYAAGWRSGGRAASGTAGRGSQRSRQAPLCN